MSDPPLSFAFYGDREDPANYAGLDLRTRLALASMAPRRKDYPDTPGKGLTALGEGIGDRQQEERLLAALSEQQSAQDQISRVAPVSSYGGGAQPPTTNTRSAVIPGPAPNSTARVYSQDEYNPLDEVLVGQEQPALRPTTSPLNAGAGAGASLTDYQPTPSVFDFNRAAKGDRLPDAEQPPAPNPPIVRGDITTIPPPQTPADEEPAMQALKAFAKPGRVEQMTAVDIPYAVPPTMEPPGAPPKPKLLPPTERMKYFEKYIDNDRVDPTYRARAKQLYEHEAAYLKADQEQHNQQYVRDYTDWKKKQDDWDKYTHGGREAGEQKALTEYFGTQKAMNEALTPIGAYELLGRRIAINPDTGLPQDVTPALDPDKLTLNEAQDKALKYYLRGVTPSVMLKSIGRGDAAIMAGLKDTLTGYVPIGGNYVRSRDYQTAANFANAWTLAFVRDESGAAIRPQELSQYRDMYFPVPDDQPRDIAAKKALRENIEKSLYVTLGPARPIADKAMRDTEMSLAPDGVTRTDQESGHKQIKRNGRWVDVNG